MGSTDGWLFEITFFRAAPNLGVGILRVSSWWPTPRRHSQHCFFLGKTPTWVAAAAPGCWTSRNNCPCRPYLRGRCCLFRHSAEDVASTSQVGMQRPAKQPELAIHVVTREEHDALAAAVRRMAASVMWARGRIVEQTGAFAEPAGGAQPPEIAMHSASTEPDLLAKVGLLDARSLLVKLRLLGLLR